MDCLHTKLRSAVSGGEDMLVIGSYKVTMVSDTTNLYVNIGSNSNRVGGFIKIVGDGHFCSNDSYADNLGKLINVETYSSGYRYIKKESGKTLTIIIKDNYVSSRTCTIDSKVLKYRKDTVGTISYSKSLSFPDNCFDSRDLVNCRFIAIYMNDVDEKSVSYFSIDDIYAKASASEVTSRSISLGSWSKMTGTLEQFINNWLESNPITGSVITCKGFNGGSVTYQDEPIPSGKTITITKTASSYTVVFS